MDHLGLSNAYNVSSKKWRWLWCSTHQDWIESENSERQVACHKEWWRYQSFVWASSGKLYIRVIAGLVMMLTMSFRAHRDTHWRFQTYPKKVNHGVLKIQRHCGPISKRKNLQWNKLPPSLDAQSSHVATDWWLWKANLSWRMARLSADHAHEWSPLINSAHTAGPARLWLFVSHARLPRQS